jgi:hypothetical protein
MAKKPLANPPFNLNHPDLKHKIEVAFTVGQRKFYRFIEDHDIPTGRYKYIYAALREADLRMSQETLVKFIKAMRDELEGGKKRQQINLGNIWQLVLNLESRCVLPWEPASVKRLAAVLYFDETEDLKTYDKMHGMKKVEFWDKNKVKDFFLTRPIVELFGLRNISPTSLEAYIQETEAMIQDLTLDQPTQSSESLSEIGK